MDAYNEVGTCSAEEVEKIELEEERASSVLIRRRNKSSRSPLGTRTSKEGMHGWKDEEELLGR